MRRWCLVLLVLTGLALQPATADARGKGRLARPFAPDSIWNLPLRADVPLHPDTDRYVASLESLIREHSAWINTTHCSQPTYWATRKTPRKRVALVNARFVDSKLVRLWSRTPIPLRARPAECSDANLAIALRRRNGRVSLWEFWHARQEGSGRAARWSASWGGYTDDIRVDRGIASGLAWRPRGKTGRYVHSNAQWNVTASSISMIAGVITKRDLMRGRINHALSMALTDTARGYWLFPAQRTDGGDITPYAVPEGAHFRLDPTVDLSSLHASPLVRMIAAAAQRYGIVIRDHTFSSSVFYTDGAPGVPQLVSGLLDGKTPASALRAFPWGRLQLVDAPSCRVYGRCGVASRAVINADPPVATKTLPLRLDTSNSQLNHPRSNVAWDLDGDGGYETSRGPRPTITLKAGAPKPSAVGVRITTRDGISTTAKLSLGATGSTSTFSWLLRVVSQGIQLSHPTKQPSTDPASQ